MNDSFLNSANAPYVAELFFKFKKDPNSIDKSWGRFFETFNEDDLSIISDFGGPKWKKDLQRNSASDMGISVKELRSINLSSAVAMVAGEACRQLKLLM